MIITKYKLPIENGYIEFLSEQEAIDYKTSNGLDGTIVEVTETILSLKPVLHTAIEQKIQNAQDFGNKLIVEFGRENILLGYTVSNVKSVIEKCSIVLSMLQTGSLYTALDELNNMAPDDLLTSSRITEFGNKIRSYLGIPLV